MSFGVFLLTLALADDVGPHDLLRKGSTPEQIERRLGAPTRRARQILYRRYLEQWLYEGRQPLRLEFNCVRGQPPRLVEDVRLPPVNP